MWAEAALDLGDDSDGSQPLQLDFREIANKIRNVIVNGDGSEYRFINEHVVIPVKELVTGSNEIRIEFTAGSSSLNRNPDYLYSLFVPDRARTAFPLFDQPDLKATFELELSIPAGWTAIANAPVDDLVERRAAGATMPTDQWDSRGAGY